MPRVPRIAASESPASSRGRFSWPTHIIIAARVAKPSEQELTASFHYRRWNRMAAVKGQEFHRDAGLNQQISEGLGAGKRQQRILPPVALKNRQARALARPALPLRSRHQISREKGS